MLLVIALEAGHVVTPGHEVHQVGDDARAIRPPIDVIAAMDQAVVPGRPQRHVGVDRVMEVAQPVEAAVNVADGIGP